MDLRDKNRSRRGTQGSVRDAYGIMKGERSLRGTLKLNTFDFGQKFHFLSKFDTNNFYQDVISFINMTST
jgi:hypothetical protein